MRTWRPLTGKTIMPSINAHVPLRDAIMFPAVTNKHNKTVFGSEGAHRSLARFFIPGNFEKRS
jgi:hypothetical protein